MPGKGLKVLWGFAAGKLGYTTSHYALRNQLLEQTWKLRLKNGLKYLTFYKERW